MSTSAADLDAVRDYWNRRPCNIRHSRAEIGSKEYFDQVEARKYMVEPHIPAFADFPYCKGKQLLEIGCGLGTDATNFARAGADYTGFELSNASLELMKKRFGIFGLKGTFYLGNAEELNDIIPSQKFDLIYSFGVIHHTPAANFLRGRNQVTVINFWRCLSDSVATAPGIRYVPIGRCLDDESATDGIRRLWANNMELAAG